MHEPIPDPRHRRLQLILGGSAAFAAYFSMYAFRKPFAAATFVDAGDTWFGLDFKTGLIVAQVIGYALSKIIGVKVIAEFGRNGRARAILILIAFSWIALLAFAVVPRDWSMACLFLNALPLGMIWGLVFSYLEGRRASEMLGAMLCASFILSSGAVKSVAAFLLAHGVSAYWMPAATGLLFAPVLLVSLRALENLPPPDASDIAERTERVPMRRASRLAFLRDQAVPMTLLIAGYILLSAIRDFRDNFAAEIWQAMGIGDLASVFSQSELPVAAITLLGLASLMLVRNNMRAVLVMHGAIVAAMLLMGGSTLAFQHGYVTPLTWMILTGAGLYLAYTPFNAMLFDRMIAAVGRSGNAGFLIYIADSFGYAGSVGLLLYRSFGAPRMNWLPFYIDCLYAVAAAVAVLTCLSAACFSRYGRDRRDGAPSADRPLRHASTFRR